MALAILRFQETDGKKSRFQVELGTNRFYIYQIGGEEMRQNGLPLLQDPIYTSPIIGPLPEASLGRTILEVPNDKFDRQHRAIQITSFRNPQKVGPASSEIVRVMSVGTASDPSFNLQMALETAMAKSPVETVPFQYREVPPVSEAMFLGGIINAVKSVAAPLIKAAAPVLGAVTNAVGGAGGVANLVGAVTGAAGGAGGSGISGLLGSLLPQLAGIIGGMTGGAEGGQPPDPGQIEALLATLQQAAGAVSATPEQAANPITLQPAPAAIATAPTAARAGQATGARPLMRSAPAPRRATVRAQSLALSAQDYYATRSDYLAQAYDADGFYAPEEEYPESLGLSLSSEYADALSIEYADALSDEYAESMFLPAIGGILASLAPKLIPLASSLFSKFGPQLANLFGSLFGGQQTAGQMSMMLGVEGEDEEDEADNAVLIALSLALAAAPTPDLVHQRVEAVTLAFTEVSPVMMHGKSRFLYRQDQDISFPLNLETPQPVRKARLQLLVKNSKTLKVLLEQNYRIETASSGRLNVVPKLSKEQLKKLAPNEEYLICATLVWQGRSRKTGQVKRLGTSTMQLITLVGEYVFDRVESSGQTIPLNDVDRFRPYWHKVWQGSFTDDVRRMNFDCKYYYTLERDRTENARMETITQVLENDMAGRKSRLKSGLILGPFGLNELLSQISSHPRLNEAELSALMSSEFKGRFNHAARTQVNFKGKPRETVALWIYPEFKLQQVMLKRVDQTNPNGHVLALKEHPVYFPMPAVAHFIGVST